MSGMQLTDGLVGGNAGSWRNQGPDTALPDELPEAQAFVALVGQQGRFGRLRRVWQDATQDRRRRVNIGRGEKPHPCIVVIARGDAGGERCPGAIHNRRLLRPDRVVLARVAGLVGEFLAGGEGAVEVDERAVEALALHEEVQERAPDPAIALLPMPGAVPMPVSDA